MRRHYLLLPALVLLAACPSDGPYSISGSATLPACTEAPLLDLSGTWFDQGTLTITSAGCESNGAPPDTVLDTCALNWEITQDGNDLEILVDGEYRMKGRMCDDTLHLQGGWWLPAEDEIGQCNYDDDDGAEVGIESGGSSLVLQQDPGGDYFTGTLSLREACTADYVMQLRKISS